MRNGKLSHTELAEALFGAGDITGLDEQAGAFASAMGEAFTGGCPLEVISGLQDEIRDMAAGNSGDGQLKVSPGTIASALESAGAAPEQAEAFRDAMERSLGSGEIDSEVVTGKGLEIKTPEVLIRVKPGCSHMVEEKHINGVRCFVVNAGGGAEVNGIRA